jgi:hypothetical protein
VADLSARSSSALVAISKIPQPPGCHHGVVPRHPAAVRNDVAVRPRQQHDVAQAPNESAEVQPQPEGLSQFISKVLDQLSLSAWLPAAMLVGCTAILLQLRSQGNFDVGAAVVALTAKPLGILVVLLFSVVLAAMVSQAFSFGAIRFLEGYWGPFLKLGIFAALVGYRRRRLRKMRDRLGKLELSAFVAALGDMLGKESSRIVYLHVHQMYYSDEPEPQVVRRNDIPGQTSQQVGGTSSREEDVRHTHQFSLARYRDKRIRKMRERVARLDLEDFKRILANMLDSQPSHVVYSKIHGKYYPDEPEPRTGESDSTEMTPQLTWQDRIPAEKAEKIDRIGSRIREHPKVHRLRPTRLGNIIRATEDSLNLSENETLQAFVLRRRELVSTRVKQHHDQYRTRLDMYCTLVFIYVILSMLSLVLFATITAPQWIGICVIAGLFLGMALVSYSAAIASAGGYCTALMEINEVKLEE